ncbi:Vps62-related protein [Paraflavitalea pollutisoli]|uniref:Vps62-related protein n=1 Tax=Paraflavitalea pollutisoli TaxID=3034143 RepID=UPI0023EDFCEE|nr:Vps62-related protein [Paraflavitalea sp. H1-2-19X]
MQTTQAPREKRVEPSVQQFLSPTPVSSFLNVVINDMESYATEKVSFWIPAIQNVVPTATLSSYAYTGYYATDSYQNPPSGSMNIYQANNWNQPGTLPCFAAPLEFVPVWTCSGNGSPSYLGIYAPTPPQGYVAIGSVAVMDFKAPPTVDQFPGFMCVRSDLATQVTLTTTSNYIWADHNSKATGDVTVFQLPNSGVCYAVSGYPTTVTAWDIVPQ